MSAGIFKFCPACASGKIGFESGKLFRCPDCGFEYYQNIAAATGCVISASPAPALPAQANGAGGIGRAGSRAEEGGANNGPDSGADSSAGGERILFLVRGKEPAKGRLDLPGGFVDIGEGALEGLRRELLEEIGWAPEVPPGASLAEAFALFASFPNAYPYKGVLYNTCDLYFCVSAPGLSAADLTLERSEIAGARFLSPEEIDFGEIAFDSTRRAVEAYLSRPRVKTREF